MLEKSKKESDSLQNVQTIAEERERLLSEMEGFNDQEKALDETEQQINTEAGQLEEQIRALAEEQKKLDEQKKSIENLARNIGDRRTDLLTKKKELARQKDQLQARIAGVDVRKSQAEQEQAYQETQKSASFQQQPTQQPENEGDQSSSHQKSGEEQRIHPRLSVEVDVTMNTEHNFYAGLTENISEGGIFIATVENLPLGTELDLKISMPQQEPVQVKGNVSWVREYNEFTSDVSPGVGVEFNDLSAGDKELIQEFISSRSPLLYEAF